MNKTIITVTGPSCSGKSTLTNMLVNTGKFTEVVSTTTRPPRATDIDGVNYHFVTREEFEQIEMLETVEFNGNLYGGSVAEFEEKFQSGLTPVIVVEPNGMNQINTNAKDKGWRVVNVFVDIDPELQAERFLGRFLSDYREILTQGDDSKYVKFMTEYCKRFASMQSVESKWYEMYLKGQMPNSNLYISRFDKDNEQQILDTVQKMV